MTDSIRTLATLELVGGAICLDFVNTLNSRQRTEHDYLSSYADLADWSVKVGLLTAEQSRRLQKKAKREEDKAADTLRKAHLLRDLLYRLFSRLASHSVPQPQDLETFTQLYGQAISHSQLVRQDNSFAADWNMEQSYDAVLWANAYSAGQILFSAQLGQLKECPGCGWLFLDTSKNQSRRWCSMNTCGARDKMRRYHRKQREN